MKCNLWFCLSFLIWVTDSPAQTRKPFFRILAIAEVGDRHQPYVDAAKKWLNAQAESNNFKIDYIENPERINDQLLSGYELFIQLNYPPYRWSDTAKLAFQKYIEEGRGGWIGFHHASLLGEFDGFRMWPWFSNWMGGIQWKDYIPTFVSGQIFNEDPKHPVMKNVPEHFKIAKEEFYTYDRSPRLGGVHVLASVDESSYQPPSTITMGDHPVVWTNEHVKARNVYIFMGHDPGLFDNPDYRQMFLNAIFWAGAK
jgi:type 1 glutamine amidotransferase